MPGVPYSSLSSSVDHQSMMERRLKDKQDTQHSITSLLRLVLSSSSSPHLNPSPFFFMLVLNLICRWQAYLCRHYALHTVNDIRKNKVNYILGFFACFLVVFVVSLVVTIIGNTPVVFLRLAELEAGEMDMVVGAAKWSGWDALNYTAVESIHNLLTLHAFL